MTPTLGFLGWIIIGGLAGWIGSKIQNRDAQMGIGLNILVGIIGAVSYTHLTLPTILLV